MRSYSPPSFIAILLGFAFLSSPVDASGPTVAPQTSPIQAGSNPKTGWCRSTIGWLSNLKIIRSVGSTRTHDAIFTISHQSNVKEFTVAEARDEVRKWVKGVEDYIKEKRSNQMGIHQLEARLADMQLVRELMANGSSQESIDKLSLHIDALAAALTTTQDARERGVLEFREISLRSILDRAAAKTLTFPIQIHLGSAPSIEKDKATGRDVVELQGTTSLFAGPLEFRRLSDLNKQIKKERRELRAIQEIQSDIDVNQAIRLWQLETFLTAFYLPQESKDRITNNQVPDNDPDQDLVLYRDVNRLISNLKPEFAPPIEATTSVRRAIAFDRNSANQGARQAIETLVKPIHWVGEAFKRIHLKFDSLTTPWKIIAAVTVLNTGLSGAWYLAKETVHWTYQIIAYDEAERNEMARNEQLRKDVFEIAGTSRNLNEFFDRFYGFGIRTYRDESIELATEFMLGNRTSLEPDGRYPITIDVRTGAVIDHYKEAKEIVEFFQVLVLGKKDTSGNLVVSGAGDRMERREGNWNNLEQLRVMAEQQSLPGILQQFGTASSLNGGSPRADLVVPDPSATGRTPLQQRNIDNIQRLKEIAEQGGLQDLLNNMGKPQGQPAPQPTEPPKP